VVRFEERRLICVRIAGWLGVQGAQLHKFDEASRLGFGSRPLISPTFGLGR
jgi:hypothetical protein